TGLWPPTAGAVIVSGRAVTGPLSIAGMAFQNPTLLPWRTTLANIMLPLEIVQPHCSRLKREWAAYLAKARDLLALVGLKRIRGSLSLAAFRWHAAASIALPGAHPRSHPAHARRAVCLARHVHTRGAVARSAGCVASPQTYRHPGHPRPARGG